MDIVLTGHYWDNYCMEAPIRQRQCVERYNIVIGYFHIDIAEVQT